MRSPTTAGSKWHPSHGQMFSLLGDLKVRIDDSLHAHIHQRFWSVPKSQISHPEAILDNWATDNTTRTIDRNQLQSYHRGDVIQWIWQHADSSWPAEKYGTLHTTYRDYGTWETGQPDVEPHWSSIAHQRPSFLTKEVSLSCRSQRNSTSTLVSKYACLLLIIEVPMDNQRLWTRLS